MPDTVAPTTKRLVSPRFHRAFMWLAMVSLLVFTSFIAPEKRTDSQLILGALTEHKVPTILCDADGVAVFSNPLALRMLGGSVLPDVIGHSITEWMEDKLAARHEEYFRQASEMPLGSKIPLIIELQVDEEVVTKRIEITVSEADGERIHLLEFFELEA